MHHRIPMRCVIAAALAVLVCIVTTTSDCHAKEPPAAAASKKRNTKKARDAAIEADRKKLTGSWRVTSIEVDGAPVTEEGTMKIVFRDDIMYLDRLSNRYKIDPTKSPRLLDLGFYFPGFDDDKTEATFDLSVVHIGDGVPWSTVRFAKVNGKWYAAEE